MIGQVACHACVTLASNRASQKQTIEALLENSKRHSLPLAHLFVQHRTNENRGRAGPLAEFVAAHHSRALELYLLAHAAASGGDFEITYDSRVWSRALGLDEARASSRNAISRIWAWLEVRRLIRRSRSGRLARITLLNDDGSGEAYQHPYDQRKRPYLSLPYEFWLDDWFRRLDLAATAVLLIARGERPGPFRLALERIPDWYGLSTSTWQAGVQTLVRLDLLKRWHVVETRPLAPLGQARVNVYQLTGPFERRDDES
jgi:hypothetical protein